MASNFLVGPFRKRLVNIRNKRRKCIFSKKIQLEGTSINNVRCFFTQLVSLSLLVIFGKIYTDPLPLPRVTFTI